MQELPVGGTVEEKLELLNVCNHSTVFQWTLVHVASDLLQRDPSNMR